LTTIMDLFSASGKRRRHAPESDSDHGLVQRQRRMPGWFTREGLADFANLHKAIIPKLELEYPYMALNITLTYSDNGEIIMIDWLGKTHKVSHVQILVDLSDSTTEQDLANASMQKLITFDPSKFNFERIRAREASRVQNNKSRFAFYYSSGPPIEWFSVNLARSSEIVEKLKVSGIQFSHSPPSRFDRGLIQGKLDENEPFTLFGICKVYQVQILYDS
jgi:hypothetical protein